MVGIKKFIVFCIIGSWVLSSCAQSEKQPIIISLSKTSTAILSNTPDVTPTQTTIFNNKNQVTDGNLRLSIKRNDDECVQSGNKIPITLTFENLTSDSMMIVDFNLISTHTLARSKGQLKPILTTEQNIRLFSREDLMTIDLVNTNPPLTQILLANDKFDVSIDYSLSTEYVLYGQQNDQFLPLPLGGYFLKFVYIASSYGGSWEGIISSNRIEICIDG